MEDTSKHYVGTISQKAIIEKDGKILISRGVNDELWELPGGKLHKDESPTKGLIREIKEELNIDVEVKTPFHVCQSFYVKGQSWRIVIGYTCMIINDSQQKVDGTEIEEMKWVSREELKDIKMFDDYQEIVDVYLDKIA